MHLKRSKTLLKIKRKRIHIFQGKKALDLRIKQIAALASTFIAIFQLFQYSKKNVNLQKTFEGKHLYLKELSSLQL